MNVPKPGMTFVGPFVSEPYDLLGTCAYGDHGQHHRETHVQSLARKLLRDTSAATAIEYGLILGLISVSVIVGLQQFGNGLTGIYQIIDGATSNAAAKN